MPPPPGVPRHDHHDNAVRAIRGIPCPLPVEQVIEHAYRVGRGNPWVGYMEIKPHLEQALDGARNPVQVMDSRLRKCSPIGEKASAS